jgi:hypothetical protein
VLYFDFSGSLPPNPTPKSVITPTAGFEVAFPCVERFLGLGLRLQACRAYTHILGLNLETFGNHFKRLRGYRRLSKSELVAQSLEFIYSPFVRQRACRDMFVIRWHN